MRFRDPNYAIGTCDALQFAEELGPIPLTHPTDTKT